MDSFASLIDKLGGAAKVAKYTGEQPGTVQQRKRRNSFPPETWPKLIEMARLRGLEGVDEAFLLKLATGAAKSDAAPQAEQAA